MGPILPIPELLLEFGIDPAQVLANVGIDPRLFDDPENRIAFDAMGRLVDACVEVTGCAHFGLLVGQRFDGATLGALGELMRHCETVDAALRSLVLYLHLNDRGAVPMLLNLSTTRTALGYSIYHRDTPAVAQINDGAIAIVHNILRNLCGASWKPTEVRFAHGAPPDLAPYREFFGAHLRFDAELTAVTFPSRWLAHRIEGADPALHAQLESAIRQRAGDDGRSLAEQVRRALHSMVFVGTASAQAVAQLFSIHVRTLRRRLLAEGTSLRELGNEARHEVARQLLDATRLPLTEIAMTLHYGDATAFSRAFRGWAGMTPSEWRSLPGPKLRSGTKELARKRR